MSHALAPKKYFQHPSYALSPRLVNQDITAAAGFKFTVYASYDNAQGQHQIQVALGKTFFTYMALLDPEIARFQIDANLP
jgi:hypothetical protein